MARAETGDMVAPQLFFGQGVAQQQEQQKRQSLAEHGGVHQLHAPRANERPDDPGGGRWQQGMPLHLHLAAVLQRGESGAPYRGAFVGAQQGHRRGGREGGKQRGDQNQPATANDGVHQAGQQRGQRNNQ